MNKRIKKKLSKRFGYKRYSEYRVQRFYHVLEDQMGNDTILYIETGKKNNTKMIHSVNLLKHVQPVSASLPMQNYVESNEFVLSFSAVNSVNDERIQSIVDRMVNRNDIEEINFKVMPEMITEEIDATIKELNSDISEKLNNDILKHLLKPPGSLSALPVDYGMTVTEYLNNWIKEPMEDEE